MDKRDGAKIEPSSKKHKASTSEDKEKAKKTDDDNLSENENEEGLTEKEIAERKEEKRRQKIRALLTLFTPEQMRRYEHFRRSHFNRHKVKKVMQRVSGCSVNDEMAIAMGGVAKIFAGEIIEAARLHMEHKHEVGPIRPSHILYAYAKLKREQPELLPPGSKGLRKMKLLRR